MFQFEQLQLSNVNCVLPAIATLYNAKLSIITIIYLKNIHKNRE